MAGLLLALGMTTKNAQRVTRAEVNTGSQGDVVRLYALSGVYTSRNILFPKRNPKKPLRPEPELIDSKKLQHYDALRAAVITSVSASVIAFASGMGLPVSTTYVAFASVVATGWADKIFQRGDAQLKMGRTIWVITCWFLSALLAGLCTAFCSSVIAFLGTLGILICLSLNLTVRWVMKRKSDEQEARLQREADERRQKLLGSSQPSKEILFASETDSREM
jgi:hypothetical protein